VKKRRVGGAGKKKKRPRCQYASSCYRKNPQHKLECRHPGDADWSSEEENGDGRSSGEEAEWKSEDGESDEEDEAEWKGSESESDNGGWA
jgi:aprataxin and PNK-like factor